MKKIITSFILAQISFASLQAQVALPRKVFSTGGKVITQNSLKLSYTIGEAIVGKKAMSSLSLNSGFQQVHFVSTPLPVQWLAMDANRISLNEVEIRWQVAAEHNNAGYYIERRLEHENEFSSVGFVEGTGTSMITLTYAFRDSAYPNVRAYYRIKQMDMDGKYSYSLTRLVIPADKNELILEAWPIPAHNWVNFRVLGIQKKETLLIRDLSGKVVHQQDVFDESPIRCSHLVPGIYLVQLAGQSLTTIKISIHD